MCNHDNDRNCQIGLILLILNTPTVTRASNPWAEARRKQIAVAAASPSHLLNRAHFKFTGKKRAEPLWNGFVKQ